MNLYRIFSVSCRKDDIQNFRSGLRGQLTASFQLSNTWTKSTPALIRKPRYWRRSTEYKPTGTANYLGFLFPANQQMAWPIELWVCSLHNLTSPLTSESFYNSWQSWTPMDSQSPMARHKSWREAASSLQSTVSLLLWQKKHAHKHIPRMIRCL